MSVRVFKDRFSDPIRVEGYEAGKVSIEIGDGDDPKRVMEVFLDPDVAMDVAAAIVRAVHG